MKKAATGECKRNCKRACWKILSIIAVVLLAVFCLVNFIDIQAVNDLKNYFSFGLIIALVLIINLVSFLCFIMLYAAYQWVRKDLKPSYFEDVEG